MNDFLSAYGLFVLEFLTVLAVGGLVFVLLAAAKRGGGADGLSARHLNREYEQRADLLQQTVLGRRAFRRLRRQRHKREKQARRDTADRRRVFVIDFKGDVRASATASLREEVSAVLAVAGDGDEVLLRLENSGGTVYEHGLAASQLVRIRQHGLRLTTAVDKVAASGGYLMASVADRIVAAPFAIIGSIGVLAQLPNFHRWLEQKGIDFEQITAGRYKRTLTLFGENTDEGRDKLRKELEDVHGLFRERILEHRPGIDIERVATGEHWYGAQALELGLIDEIGTSDDLLTGLAGEADLYLVSYRRKRQFIERLLSGAESLLSR